MNKAKISAILLVIITIVSTISFFIVVATPEQPWIDYPYGSFVSNYMYKDMKWSIYQYNSTHYFGVSDWGMHLTINFQSIQEVKNVIQSIQSD